MIFYMLVLSGSTSGLTWGISSIFGSSDNRSSVKESLTNKPYTEPAQNMEHAFSMIHLKEVNTDQSIKDLVLNLKNVLIWSWQVSFYSFQPPSILRPSECSETESIEIAITKLLLRSYYDIVRKNIEDSVPKAIIHFLVSFRLSRFANHISLCLFLFLILSFTFKFLITKIPKSFMVF